jgi:ABC-2 type transport system permease protein
MSAPQAGGFSLAGGIDLVQWRALVRVALLSDLRMSGRAFDLSGRARGGQALTGTLLTLVAMGGGVAFFLALTTDLLLGAIVHLFVLAFVVASSLLVEYQSVVLSPADHRQLSFQPVTSRTFLAARLTSVLIYVLAMTAAFSVAPFITLLFIERGGPLVAIAALGGAILEAITVTLIVIGGYVTVLKIVPAARLTRALSYVQLGFSFFVYGSYLLIPRYVAHAEIVTQELPRERWMLLNPTVWFAGWTLLASGEHTALMAAASAFSIAALAASALIVGGRLSIGYAERLIEAEMAPGASRSGARPQARLTAGWLFANGEARAVAVLARAQFRYDNRFRLMVLSILPLTLVYLFTGLGDGGLDPFETGHQGHTLVYMAVMMFPPMLRSALSQSDAHAAAWIFLGTPADRRALVLALRNVLAVWFLAPYLAFLGVLYLALVSQPMMVPVHILLLGLFSHLLLMADLLVNPDLPFSRPHTRGARTGATFFSILAAVLVGSMLRFVLEIVYASQFALVVTIVGLIALAGVAEAALRLRLRDA